MLSLPRAALRTRRRSLIGVSLIVALVWPAAGHAYEAIRPFTPLGARLAALARRTGQPLAPMLEAGHPWTPPAPSFDPASVTAREALRQRLMASSPSGAAEDPAPIEFANPAQIDLPFPDAIADFDRDGRGDLVRRDGAGIALTRSIPDGFGVPVSYPLPGPASAEAVGDVDGDGFLDVVAWAGGVGLATLRGLGDGTLADAKVSPLAGVPFGFALALADVDGDGRLDAVGLETNDSTLIVALNVGDGTFPSAERYAMGDWALWLAVGDFNGDGLADVATAGFPVVPYAYPSVPVRALNVRLAVDGGALGSRQDYDVSHLPGSIAAGDLNGDGRTDLVVSSFLDAYSDVLLSHADGTFGVPETYAPVPETHRPGVFALADMDGDGHIDLLVGAPGGDCVEGACMNLAILHGVGNGSFSDPIHYMVASGWNNAHNVEFRSMLAGDLDGDHFPDVLIRLHGYGWMPGPATLWLRNRPGGSLIAPVRTPVGTGPYALAAGHFLRGAPPDLVTSGSTAVSVARNLGGGTFLPPVDLAPGALGAVVDLDGDGLDDVVVAADSITAVFYADGAGGFVPGPERADGWFLTAGDFTGDGRPDLSVILPGCNVGVLPSNGHRGFGPVLDFGQRLRGAYGTLKAVDLDGDGRADLAGACGVWAESDTLSVLWSEGDHFAPVRLYDLGPGGPIPPRSYDYFPMPSDMQSGDFDGDGRPDLVVAKGTDGWDLNGAFDVVLNQGGREFSAATQYVAGNDPFAVAVADFDRDGLDDIAIANVSSSWDGRISVYRSREGVFEGLYDVPASNHWVYSVEHYPDTIVADDFDGDGLPDLSVGCLFPSDVITLPNVSPAGTPTATLADLINSAAFTDRVQLEWRISGTRAREVAVERRTVAAGWAQVERRPVDGTGLVEFEDRAVSPGVRYAYRLRVGVGAGATTTAESWIDVPYLAALAVGAAGPNPSRGRLRVAYSLVSGESARLELYDVTGRRLATRVIAPSAPGRGEIGLEDGGALASGLYFVTLTQGTGAVRARLALVR